MTSSANTWSILLAFTASCVFGTTITRFQTSPLPECEPNTVCTEISQLPPVTNARNYYSRVACTCPNGQVCPKSPGKQTLDIGNNRWYGLCQSVSEVDECEEGDIAAEKFVEIDGDKLRKSTKVYCLCSGKNVSIRDSSTSSIWGRTKRSESAAKTVYQLTCGDQLDNMKKRGERHGGRAGFRRFYFY